MTRLGVGGATGTSGNCGLVSLVFFYSTLIVILARVDLRFSIPWSTPSLNRKSQNGRFSKVRIWTPPILVPRTQSPLTSVVELTVTEDSLSNVPSEKSSQIRYLSSWKTLGIQTILLYLLMNCRRSTVDLCLGRLLESPGFACRHPSRC